eukprot:752118_1
MSTYMAHTCTQCKKNTCKKKKGSVYYKQCDTCRAQHRNWKAKRNKTSIVEHVCVYKSSCGNKTSLRVYKSNTNTHLSNDKYYLYCDDCRAEQKQKKRARQSHAAGKCTTCKTNDAKSPKRMPNSDGSPRYFKQCDTCRAKHRQQDRERVTALKAERVCTTGNCGNKTSINRIQRTATISYYSQCDDCRAYNKQRYNAKELKPHELLFGKVQSSKDTDAQHGRPNNFEYADALAMVGGNVDSFNERDDNVCHWCGVTLTLKRKVGGGVGGCDLNQLSFDRIFDWDNSDGHTLGNLVKSCWQCQKTNKNRHVMAQNKNKHFASNRSRRQTF